MVYGLFVFLLTMIICGAPSCMMKIMLTREKCITRQSVPMNISMVAVPVVSVEIAYCSRSSKFTAAARPKLPRPSAWPVRARKNYGPFCELDSN